MSIRAVITAGGVVDGALADAMGTPVKALARVGERTMLDAALDACTGAGIIDVAVVGGREVSEIVLGRGFRAIDAAADGRENVLRALGAWPGERFVYLASDLPFAGARGVADFIERSRDSAVTMALAETSAYAQRFPGAPAHGVTLRGESVANGSAFVFAPEAAVPARAFAVRAFAARKNLVALARLLGPALLARFALRRLRIADIEAYASRELGMRVAAVRGCDPGLCFDVDTLEDHGYACSRLA